MMYHRQAESMYTPVAPVLVKVMLEYFCMFVDQSVDQADMVMIL